jgi:branched-chain amino acid transport system substrate-binding protein
MIRSLCVIAALCALVSLGSATAADVAPLEINVILPLTGQGAFAGVSSKNGLTASETIANREGGIHGRPVRFVYYDDQTNPQVSLQLTSQLVAKKVAIVMGPGLTSTCRAVAAAVEQGPVSYCFSPGIDPAAGSYVFAAGASVREFTRILYRYAHLRGWKRFAAIYTTDATGQIAESMTNEVLKDAEFKDASLVAAEHFNAPDINIAAQIARIKAAKPDVVVAWPTGTPFGTTLRSMADAGFELPVLATAGNLSYEQLKSYSSFLPKELYFESSPYVIGFAENSAMKRKDQQLQEAATINRVHVDAQAGTAFDIGELVIEAFRKYGAGATADQLRGYLAQTVGYTGTSGTYDFRTTPQRGLSIHNLLIVRFDVAKGAFVRASQLGGEPLR